MINCIVSLRPPWDSVLKEEMEGAREVRKKEQKEEKELCKLWGSLSGKTRAGTDTAPDSFESSCLIL